MYNSFYFKLSCLFLLFFISCQSKNTGKKVDLQLLSEFQQLHSSTQQFFDGIAKVQCACLKEYQEELEKMLKNSSTLVEEIKEGKRSLEDQALILELEKEIYPILSSYNQCNEDAPQPAADMMTQVQEDMKNFSGASEPGGNSYDKMQLLSNALMRKHCGQLQALGIQINQLAKDISPGVE